MRRAVGEATLELSVGDIASQPDADAVVNAANAELGTGGGVAGAIHRAAGPGLAEECRPLAPIQPGEAVITGAHDLPNRFVIHTLGPVFGRDEPSDALLSDCYRNSLRLAEGNGCESIAFPAVSTGVFGYPLEAAAVVALGTTLREMEGLSGVRLVRFVLFSEREFEAHEVALEEV